MGLPLSASDVHLSYPLPGGGAVEVLNIGRLSAGAGELVGITGPSGSGKTSLLHVLAGLERPERGTVLWDGADILAFPEGRRDRWRRHSLGLVFQDFQLFPGLSACPRSAAVMGLLEHRQPPALGHVLVAVSLRASARDVVAEALRLASAGDTRHTDVTRSSRSRNEYPPS